MIIQAAQEAWSTPPMVCGPCSPQLNPPPAHRRRVAGMVKLVYCVRRREDVAEDEFHRYWLDEHGPLVRSVADAIGAVRYVQSHAVSPELNAFLRQSRGSAEPYDGITEVGGDSDQEPVRLVGPAD